MPMSLVKSSQISSFSITVYLNKSSNVIDAKDMEQLKANNITHVLSIHDNAQAILEVRYSDL